MMDQNEYIRRIAARNLTEKDARHFEPRFYYDKFVFDGSTERVYANLDVFRNAEKFPVRITHILAAMRYETSDAQSPAGGDERVIQRYGLRIRAHGTYYQNAEITPIPLMANRVVAASDIVTMGLASWHLQKPAVLGNRDTLQFEVALLTVSGEERVAVSVDGVGLYSRLPKRLTSYVDIDEASKVYTLDVDDFRNDGTEPLEITSISLLHTPSVNNQNPVSNVRNVRVRARLNGNGTNQWWVTGPSGGTPLDALQDAQLFGLTAGRAVVHKLPGDGWLWYPNEGVTPEIHSFSPTREETVVLAMAGYLMLL